MSISQIFDFVNKLSSVLQVPGEIVGILAVPSAIIAYLSGRRRSLFEGSGTATNDALLAEVRQGFQAMAAAIATLSVGQILAPSVPIPPSAAMPQQPGQMAVESTQSAQSAPAIPFSLPDLPLVLSARLDRPRPRVRYLALAIVSAVGLVMTLCWVGGYIIYSQYVGRPEADLLANQNYGFFNTIGFLGLLVTFIVMVWACIRALSIKQYRWAIALFVGTIALTVVTLFTMPGLLILIFAVWGPGRATATPTSQPSFAVPAAASVPVGSGAGNQEPFSGS